MANILVITYEVPFPLSHGMALHLYHLFRGISKEHRATLLFPAISGWEERAQGLQGIFHRIAPFPSEQGRRSSSGRIFNIAAQKPSFYFPYQYRNYFHSVRTFIERILREEKIHLIHCNNLRMTQFFLDGNPMPGLFDMEDCDSLRLQRMIEETGGGFSAKFQVRRIHRYERIAVNAFNCCTTVSEADSWAVRSLGTSTPVHTIPNGVDLEFFKPSGVPEAETPTVIFFGNLAFPPNTDAALFLGREIMPLVREEWAEARAIFAGKNPPSVLDPLRRDRRNRVTGFVGDLRPLIEESHVVSVPLRMGSGIKNKAMEAMALERPVVATPLGIEALDVEEGRHVLVGKDAGEVARKICLLFSNEALRRRLGREGREWAEENFHWSRSCCRYLELYEDLLSGGENKTFSSSRANGSAPAPSHEGNQSSKTPVIQSPEDVQEDLHAAGKEKNSNSPGLKSS